MSTYLLLVLLAFHTYLGIWVYNIMVNTMIFCFLYSHRYGAVSILYCTFYLMTWKSIIKVPEVVFINVSVKSFALERQSHCQLPNANGMMLYRCLCSNYVYLQT